MSTWRPSHVNIRCPSCRTECRVPSVNIGKRGRCKCGEVFDLQVVPDPQSAPAPAPVPAAAHSGKFCATCGNAIHKAAEICPKCGVRQAAASIKHLGCMSGGLLAAALLITSICVLMGLISVGATRADPMVKFHPQRNQLVSQAVAGALVAYGFIWVVLAGPLLVLCWFTRGR